MNLCDNCKTNLTKNEKYCVTCGYIYKTSENPYAPPQFEAVGFIKNNKNPWQHFICALKKYAVFSGRAGRAEYWSFYLFHTIFYISFNVIDSVFNLYILGNLGKR
jgi:hypothetical protein